MSESENIVDFMRLLSACVLNNNSEYPDGKTLDWKYVYATALKGDVVSLLLPAARFYRENGTIDEQLFSSINRRATALAFEEVKKSDYAVKFVKALENSGVKTLVLKGPSLKALYPYPELRRMSDLDLLLVDAEFENVFNTAEEVFENVEHGEDFSHLTVDRILNVDLLKKLYPEKDDSLFDEYELNGLAAFDNPALFSFYSESFNTLGCDDNALYLCYHMFKHFIFGGIGIRQTCDYALFIKNFKDKIDAEKLFERAEKIKMKKFLYALLKITQNYFGVDVSALTERFEGLLSEEETLEVLKDMLEGGVFGLYGNDREIARSFVFRKIQSRNGYGHSFFRTVFPKYAYMKERFKYLNGVPVLLPFAYVQRLFVFAFTRLFKRENMKNAALVRKAVEKRMKIMDSLDL